MTPTQLGKPVVPGARARVASLTERRLADPTAVIAGLPPDARPLPSVTAYDELLHRRTTRTPPTPTEPGAGSTKGQVS